VGDAELGVELGTDEDRAQSRDHQPVDGAGVRVALDDDLATELREGEAGGLVALRRAVREEPRAPGSPGVGRHRLGLLEGSWRHSDIDAVDDHRHVE